MLPSGERIISIPRSKYLPSHIRGIQVPKDPATVGGYLRRRRLELKLHQSQVAQRLGISTVALSRWECDKVYPSWEQQPKVAEFLGFDPFANPALGRFRGNETYDVAVLTPEATLNIGQQIVKKAIELKKSRQQIGRELGINAKTIRNWELGRKKPSPALMARILKFLAVKTP
jgi:transcriptional regulator with XRE-family HTH domain